MSYKDPIKQKEAKHRFYLRYKEKQLARNKEKVLEAKALVTKLKDFPCMDCGQKFMECAMDFDHRPDEKKIRAVSVMVLRGFPLERIIAEIAKCDLVCANCHRIRTWNRKQAVLAK